MVVGDGSGHGPPVQGVAQFGAQVRPLDISKPTVTALASYGPAWGSYTAVSIAASKLSLHDDAVKVHGGLPENDGIAAMQLVS